VNAAEAAGAATVETPGTVTIILTDPCDWAGPVSDAARLAASNGKRLRVVIADSAELLTAASLDCVRLLASGGGVSAFDPTAARRLLKAQTARLRGEVERLARRYGLDAEVVELTPSTLTGFWAGSAALTVFGRRRRGVLLVVHAGTSGTLEIAARLAAERRQSVRLLSAGGADAADAVRRLLSRWMETAAEPLAPDAPLPQAGRQRIAAMVLDPAYVEGRRLHIDALLAEIKGLMRADTG
jgi:hypothetical protein